jgi:hypothetical protein
VPQWPAQLNYQLKAEGVLKLHNLTSEKPECPGSEAGGRRGLGFATLDKVKNRTRAVELHGAFYFVIGGSVAVVSV